MLERLVRRLASASVLSDDEKRAFVSLFSGVRRIAPGEDLMREGEAPTTVGVMLDGLACRYRTLTDGRRQIISFLLPSDLVDLHSLMLGAADHSIGALTPCKLTLAPQPRFQELVDQSPSVARALWRETLIDAAVGREWMIGLGRRSAYQRIAHLLCEVTSRMRSLGLTNGQAFDLPLTQQELADSLGLSLVHVNRVLQRLRSAGLVTLGRGALQILDWDGLQQAAGFDGAYLRVDAAAGQVARA